MWRIARGALVAVVFTGCANLDTGPETGGPRPHYGRQHGPPVVPGVQGPYGTSVPMVSPYSAAPPGSQYAAARMMNQSVPMNMVQFNPPGSPIAGGQNMPSLPVPPGGVLSPPGVPFAPGAIPGTPGMSMAPGPIQKMSFSPGEGGVVHANVPPGAPSAGVVQAQYGINPAVAQAPRFPAQRTQVRFTGPAGMKVYWFTQGADGKPVVSSTPLEAPGRYNFAQAAIYRLKLTRIPGLPGQELYPTLEVVPGNAKTDAFLQHSSVPVEFTADDFKQIADGNYLVKVIYLPDPQFQDPSGNGTGEISSTRLEPGQDPIQEALRRGSILLVIRVGNVDQEVPNSPPLSSAAPHAPKQPVFGPPPGTPLFQQPYLGVPGMPPGTMPGQPGAGMPGMPVPPSLPAGAANGLPPGMPAPFMIPGLPPLPPGAAPAMPPANGTGTPGSTPPVMPPANGATEVPGKLSVAPTQPVDAPAGAPVPGLPGGLVVPPAGAAQDLQAPPSALTVPANPTVPIPPVVPPAPQEALIPPVVPPPVPPVVNQ